MKNVTKVFDQDPLDSFEPTPGKAKPVRLKANASELNDAIGRPRDLSNSIRPSMMGRLILLAVAIVLLWAAQTLAVQVQDLGRLKGSEQNKIVGMGLVIGLAGTGDGGKFLPAMRPLAQMSNKLLDPNTSPLELKDAENVAVVTLHATLPASGVREGDRVDLYVQAVAAKSLKGGRLFLTPMTGPFAKRIMAYAEGAIVLEDTDVPTAGVIRGGAQLTRDVLTRHMDQFGQITFVLDENSAGWPVAKNVAELINGELVPDGPPIARALDPKNVVIEVPIGERSNPANFVSRILTAYLDPAHIDKGARVIINERTGTIAIGGNVQISPVTISHKGFTIKTVLPEPRINEENPQLREDRFVKLDPEDRGGAKLADLIDAFNQLKVDARDRIAIVKLLHSGGYLHAKLVFE